MNSHLKLANQYGNVAGMLASEKLDGWQGRWDGSTLTTRSGKQLHAPGWWLERLPDIPLQGELFIMRADRGRLSSIISRKQPGAEWSDVTFNVFDSPNDAGHTFGDTYKGLAEYENDVMHCANQIVVPHDGGQFLARMIASVKQQGGEGVIVRDPAAPYSEAWDMLKYKPLDDAEGVVVGCVTGCGHLLGRLGSLVIQIKQGITLAISGFARKERNLSDSMWAVDNPGARCPSWIQSLSFPTGSRVTYQYRGLSAVGIPNHAAYLRPYCDTI